jgi:hypothetical protein
MAVCDTIEDSEKDTDDCTTLWRYFVWLYRYVGQGTFLDTIGKHFWIWQLRYACLLGHPSTWNSSAPTADSRDPTFFIHQFFEPLGYGETSCGSIWNRNWVPQVKCALVEDPGVYLGEEIYKMLEQQASESSDTYIWFRKNCWLSYQWNICISLISKVRNARCML